MVTSTGTFVSCKDYDDDIDAINKELTDLKSQLDALQTKFEAGKYITGVTKTDNGLTIALNDGTSYEVTNGQDGTPGEKGEAGSKVTVNEDGYWVIDDVVTEYVAVKKDQVGGSITIKTPTVSEDGCWVFYDEKGEAHPTTIKVAPVVAVENADKSFTLTVYDAEGKAQTIKLPTAASLLTELDLMGWAEVADASDNFSESDIKTTTVLDVKFKHVDKIIKVYDGNKETTWSAQKDVVKKQVLTTLSPLDIKLVARIAPASVDWADFSFTLQDSKGAKLPITLKTAEAFTGTLTRATANSSIGFIPMDVVADTYNSAAAYKALFNANAANSLYSLVEASGYRSTYGVRVTANDAITINQQNVVAVNPKGTVVSGSSTGDGSQADAFVIDLNTPTRLVFGSKPEYVYDYYVEPVDPKVAAEFGFSTDKKAGTITMTKASDLVSKAGMELYVYALHIDGKIYRTNVWVKPSSIMSTGVVLKAGDKTISPILDANGVITRAGETTFTVSLDEMFANMSQTDKDRWLSTVMGANAGAEVVKVEAANEAPLATNYSIDYLDKDGYTTADNSKAVALRVYAKYKATNTAVTPNVDYAILTPEKEYTMTVNFKHTETTGSSVLNTVKVTFTPVLPDLSTFLAKKTGYWNDNILMAYFNDPTNAEQVAGTTLASTFEIKKGFSTFGKVDAAQSAIATITLGLDGAQKLADDKPVVVYTSAGIDQINSLAVINSNEIELKTAHKDANGKVRAYNEDLNVIVAIDYLGVYNYKETATYKEQLKNANFQINVQSALIAGAIKALGSTSIAMTPAAAGEVWKLTAEHVSGYTYSNNQETPYNIFQEWLMISATPETFDAKYKYTYIKDVTFSSVDTDYYVITDKAGDAVSEANNEAGVNAIAPELDSDNKEIASYLPLKSVNTTEHIKTTLKITVEDMYGYKKTFNVPLEINPASK